MVTHMNKSSFTPPGCGLWWVWRWAWPLGRTASGCGALTAADPGSQGTPVLCPSRAEGRPGGWWVGCQCRGGAGLQDRLQFCPLQAGLSQQQSAWHSTQQGKEWCGERLSLEGKGGGRSAGNQPSCSPRREWSGVVAGCSWRSHMLLAFSGKGPSRPVPQTPAHPAPPLFSRTHPLVQEFLLKVLGGASALQPQPGGLTPLPPGPVLWPMISAPGRVLPGVPAEGCGVCVLHEGTHWEGWWRGQGPGLGPGWGRGWASLLGHGTQELLHVRGQQVVHLVALAEEGGGGCGSGRGLTRPGSAQLLPQGCPEQGGENGEAQSHSPARPAPAPVTSPQASRPPS